MGHKKKEKLTKPQEKGKSFVEPWPNLPQQLLNFIGSQHPDETDRRMQNVSFRGVTKSWRAASKQCSAKNARLPWLEISDRESKTQEHTLNISFRPGEYLRYSRRPWYTPWTRFYGCSHGLIVAGGKHPAQYYLVIRTERHPYWIIPPWDPTIPFKFATLSSSPHKNYKECYVLVLTGCSNPAFVVSHLGCDNKWMKEENTLLDPNCSKGKLIQFTNAIGFGGKFYALSLQGTLAVIEEIESKFQITRLSRRRSVPSVFSKHFTEYLVESNGEILLIFLLSEQSTIKVDKVEVLKLQVDDLSWSKLDNLGNRTLFAGTNCCMSVNANQLGCRSNCVYFIERATNTWWFYEMGSATISPCYDDYGSQTNIPVWEEPILENKFLGSTACLSMLPADCTENIQRACLSIQLEFVVLFAILVPDNEESIEILPCDVEEDLKQHYEEALNNLRSDAEDDHPGLPDDYYLELQHLPLPLLPKNACNDLLCNVLNLETMAGLSEFDTDDRIEMNLEEPEGWVSLKRGIIVEGIEIRPKMG